MAKPLIGITTGEIRNKDEPWSPITYGQSHTYSDAIIQAGGIPILLPITDDVTVIAQYIDTIDGLLLAGGNDVNPELYGQEPHAETKDFSIPRDTTEAELIRLALAADTPILAICRGMQLLNVVRGGTLYQHIASDVAGASDHQISTKRQTRTDIAHTLQVEPGSKLAAILGDQTVNANTHHHQAVSKLGDGLTVTARSEDGIVEAIEAADKPFLLGIQCHPESLSPVEAKWDKLFEAFVQSAA